ncbi:MAG: sugar transferase [Chloroflexota bacterium]
MKLFLLANGEETALKTLHPNIPSPMVPVVNYPVMVYSLELLHRYGYKDAYVNLSHLGEQIEAYFGQGERWGMNLTYLLHRNFLGTAGTIQRVRYHIDGTFIVLPASSLIEFDIDSALDLHRSKGSIATAILQRPHKVPVRSSQFLQVGKSRLVIGVDVVPDDTDEICFNTGAYIFEPDVLDYIPEGKSFDCHFDLLPTLLESGETVAGFVTEKYWNPIDSFASYQHAQGTYLKHFAAQVDQNRLNSGLNLHVDGQEIAKGVWTGKNCYVHPTAKFTPPVYIGAGSEVGSGSQVGPNVVIGSRSVLGKNVSIKDSTVFGNTYIGESLEVYRKLINQDCIGDIDNGDSFQVYDPMVLTTVSPSLLRYSIRFALEKLLALLFFIVLLPLMMLIALSILYTSRGATFTRVEKMGTKPGRSSHSSKSGPQSLSLLRFQTRTPDNTLSAIGHTLERFELHRLPELWSVLCGELGFVGVEPIDVEQVALIQDEWQQKRFECRAGFTGFWYTRTTGGNDIDERWAVDAYYAATHTMWEDWVQIFSTPLAWLRRRMIHETGTPVSATHQHKNNDVMSKIGLTHK